jgi:aminoglycoside 3-N-acetyltransferase
MTLRDVIAATPGGPSTVATLLHDLQTLGMQQGSTLMAHCSLSTLGYVNGDAPAVIEALTQALGPAGTLVMPTHSSNLSDPAGWSAPAVPREWHQTIRDTMPAYDPAITPTRSMGAVAENFRTHPGVLRSAHPRQSCAARGANARRIVADHPFDCAMGEHSPMGRLYELDAWVLLLGVMHDRNTSLHLAEVRASYPTKKNAPFASPVTIDSTRHWLTVDDLDFDDSDFPRIGADYERDTESVITGPVGQAPARLMRMRPLVDYAVSWMGRNRR